MIYAQIEALAGANSLMLMGGHQPDSDPHLPEWCKTLLLLGPSSQFWTAFTASPEWQDKRPDPVDRWSTRVMNDMATALGGEALFPFGGPPFKPFFTWALQSGHAWQSPVNLLVHSQAGLMVSYRGAIALRDRIDLPAAAERPCDTCDQPCLTACTPRALTAGDYDVEACKAHVTSEKGQQNKSLGCNVRRACPVSQSYARMEAQSAYHMRIFVGESR